MMDNVITYLFKPTECTPKVNPNINYGVWVIMICQCSFISCNECITLVEDVHNGERERNAYVEAWGLWEMSVLSPQYSCEPKTILIN